MNRDQQLAFVQEVLNAIIRIGKSPPKTCDGLVKLFDGRVSKETLCDFFKRNEVKWVQAPGTGESYEQYNREMNECAAFYMSQ